MNEAGEAKDVLRYFEAISKIPRVSGNMEGISAYVLEECRRLGADAFRDEACNVIARVEATPGYEDHPTVMLQGHLDMVGQKDPESTHDFKKDPIRLIYEDDILHADHTTLGADDGVAVASMLSILADKTLPHPALECVFTTDEETSMVGATALDLGFSKAAYLINLDNEAEGLFTVSCAGGARFDGSLSARRVMKRGKVFLLTVKSDVGGHSGTEIHWDRPNTNKVAGALLSDLQRSGFAFDLISFEGGSADNAIPTRTSVRFLAEEAPNLSALEKVYQAEYATTGDAVHFEVLEQGEAEEAVLTEDSLKDLIDLLLILPNGVIDYNHEIRGLVETSLNLGVTKMTKDCFRVRFSVRSSMDSKKKRLLSRLVKIMERFKGGYEIEGEYPGWAFKPESAFRDHAVSLWNEMYPEKKAKVLAIHAGLECGLLIEKKPDLDIISIGPDAIDIHTPKEYVRISSMHRVYAYICRLLKEL